MSPKPRCKKCGRVLKDPVSIAAGMGPVCRGGSGGGRASQAVRSRRSHGHSYDGAGHGHGADLLPLGDLSGLFDPKPKTSLEQWLERVSVETGAEA